MINLKKHDAVADAVKEILQQEALKGNQDKIDANHNGKIDGQDFKILRGKKKVEEELKGNQDKIDANHNGKVDGEDFKILRAKKKVKEEAERTEDSLDGKPKAKKKDDVGPGSDAKSSKVKLKSEEVEELDELSKSTLGSYLDKKKSEYMKGKTQSGSKENAKDIQNMGKAHDKMKKEEYTLKQMKERLEEPVLDELINEVLSKDASAGAWIHDFVHSDNPKFAGKSTAKRKEMALAAYYSKKNEEVVQEGLKDAVKTIAKKTFKALTGGSDKDHLDRLKKDMYKKEEVEHLDEGKMDKMTLSGLWHKHAQHSYSSDQGYGHGDNNPRLNDHAATAIENHVRKHHGNKVADDMVSHSDHFVAHAEYAGPKEAPHHEKEMAKLKKKHGIHDENLHEGWDDMVKDAKEKVKSGPKPNGGSGKKEGSSYGGSKQKEKPEQEVKEGKDPNMDAGCGSQPNFATDMTKPMKVAQRLAKNSLGRMRNEMMGKKNV